MWINEELNQRGWSRNEAARRGHISPEAISQVMSGKTKPGPKMCQALATAFVLPIEEVYKRAGLLPERGDILPEVLDWSNRLRRFSPDRRTQTLQAMEQVLRISELT